MPFALLDATGKGIDPGGLGLVREVRLSLCGRKSDGDTVHLRSSKLAESKYRLALLYMVFHMNRPDAVPISRIEDRSTPCTALSMGILGIPANQVWFAADVLHRKICAR